jgi:hypothetical protein
MAKKPAPSDLEKLRNALAHGGEDARFFSSGIRIEPEHKRDTFRFWKDTRDSQNEHFRPTSEPTASTRAGWSKIDQARLERVEKTRREVFEALSKFDAPAKSLKISTDGILDPDAEVVIRVGPDDEPQSVTFAREQIVIQTAASDPPCEPPHRVLNTLDIWGALLPTRIFNEELGDFIEDINRRAMEGQRCGVYLRMIAAMFWTGVNAVGYFLKEIGKRKAA